MPAVRTIARCTTRAVRLSLRVTVALAGLALTVGMIAVALLPHVGARAMIVTSGSMEPAINVGGLVIVEETDPEQITVGDVITFNGYGGEGLTTHRVIDRSIVGGRLHFRTQGDANDTPDVDLAPAEGVVGRVRADLPHAGRVLAEFSRPELRYLALGGVSVWLLAANALALAAALRNRRPVTTDAGTIGIGRCLVIAVVLVSAAVTLQTRTTAAILTDSTPITDNTFTTGTW